MIVLSWIVLVFATLLGVVDFINMLSSHVAAKRIVALIGFVFFVITFIVAYANIF